jgi:hypothetical protein
VTSLAIAYWEDELSAGGDPAHRNIDIDTTAAGSTTNLDQIKFFVGAMGDAVNASAIRGRTPKVRAYIDNVSGNFPVYGNDRDASFSGPTSVYLVAETPADSVSFRALRPRSFRLASAATVEALSTVKPGRVFWSKPGQPEAVPLVNFTDIGDVTRRILAMVPTEDALLVFKEDGIFSITGSAPSSWVVNDLDRTKRLIAPQAVDVLDGVAFAWTDRGIVPVTAGGVGDPISAPIADVLRPYQLLLPRGVSGAKQAFWIKAHPRLGLLVVGVGSSASDEITDAQFVWCRATGAWSRWTREDRCMAYDVAEDRMIASPGISAWAMLYERTASPGTGADHKDHTIAVFSGSPSLSPAGVLTVVAADFGGYVPKACDIVGLAGYGDGGGVGYYEVSSVATSGANYLITLVDASFSGEISLSVAVSRWSQGWSNALMWQAQHLAGLGQRWQEEHVHFGTFESEYQSSGVPVYVGGMTELDTSVATVEATVGTANTKGRIARVGVPRECVRGQRLYPYVKICSAGVYFEIEHVYLHHATNSKRVVR